MNKSDKQINVQLKTKQIQGNIAQITIIRIRSVLENGCETNIQRRSCELLAPIQANKMKTNAHIAIPHLETTEDCRILSLGYSRDKQDKRPAEKTNTDQIINIVKHKMISFKGTIDVVQNRRAIGPGRVRSPALSLRLLVLSLLASAKSLGGPRPPI